MNKGTRAADPVDNIGGNIHLFMPVSWHVFSYSLFAVIVVLGIALALGTYTRAETVTGELAIGGVRVVPSRSGLVGDLLVHDGDFVEAGAPLAAIRVEEIVSDGRTGPGQVIAALDRQEEELRAQQRASEGVTGSSRGKLAAQAAGQRAAIAALDRQIEQQNKLIDSAVADLGRIQSVADRGFISRRDMSAREDSVSIRRQQLAALQQSRADKTAELNATQKAADEALAQNRVVQSEIAGSRAAVARQRYEVAASRGYTLVAPVSGRVTGMTARPGQPAPADQPLLSVVPYGARLQATLFVPTRAAGFLAVGQDVRLQVDAFPFATFGAIPGRVMAVSPTTIDRPGPMGGSEAVYVVTCSVARATVAAFGRQQRLTPGMTLKARLVIRRSSLIEWLFEPIYAIARE